MTRSFNNHPVELLAPAGTFEILKAVIDTKCDAVYCGGQHLNMRMIRKGFNLSNEELKEAVALADDRNKRLYVTVNSLINTDELNEADEYLDILKEDIKPHGLIIQDAAVLRMAAAKKMDIPLHASVMMNVHNLDIIRFLEGFGVSRVVLSREMTLEQARAISSCTDVELEYFTHGDMCVTHGSQCFYSSFLFGMSSNRGRCLKPCRWPFSQQNTQEPRPFPLAVKDINLHRNLGDMLLAGITSFKIEGRMREKDFITGLINRYGEALDRFLEDPLGSKRPDPDELEPFKKRDFSTGYAFGNPGIDNINSRGEGTGKFYSTGKMFSIPTEETEIKLDNKNNKNTEAVISSGSHVLSLRVNSAAQARAALIHSPGRIYLSLEPLLPDTVIAAKELEKLSAECQKAGTELFLALPRMTDEKQNRLLEEYLRRKLPVDGLLTGHSGFLKTSLKGYRIACDSTMNIYNPEAVSFYAERGIDSWTASIELPEKDLLTIPEGVSSRGLDIPAEVIIHGLPTVMYMDHDISGKKAEETRLVTEKGELAIKRDCWDRYHLLPCKDYSLIPSIPELFEAGYSMFRLELQAYTTEEITELTGMAKKVLSAPETAGKLLKTMKSHNGGFTYGAFSK